MRRFGLALFLLTAACRHSPTTAECDAMLDRYLDMNEDDDHALVGHTGSPRAELRAARMAERKAAATYHLAESRCVREVSLAEHECAMKAPNPNEWESCFEFH